MERVRKVVAYITKGTKLLVLKHRDHPEIGIEVPAGTVEKDEDLEKAVLREIEEETGLTNVKLKSYLGQKDWLASIFNPAQVHERHFFHLEAQDPVQEEWLHYEMHPSGGDGKPVAYNLFWVEKEAAELFWEKGALLHKVKL